MRFIDIDFHEFDVFALSLQGSSCLQDVFVELGFDSADVASAILLALPERFLEYFINFALDEVEL